MRLSFPTVPLLTEQEDYSTPREDILCPMCGEEISLSGALRSRYYEKLDREFRNRAQAASALIRQKERLLEKKAQLLQRGIEAVRKLPPNSGSTLSLEDTLKKFCITDIIDKPSLDGKVVHQVISAQGERKGLINWWIKGSRGWTDDWIERSKFDRAKSGAQYAVIVNDTLPDGIEALGFVDEVWVCDTKTAPALANALRFYLAT